MESMKRGLKFCLVVLVVLLLMLLLAPLIVNVLFLNEAPCELMRAQFSAGDLLGYLGSAVVGIGSILFAMYAVLQTDRIDKVELEMQKRQESFERRNTKRPFFIADSVLIDDVPIEANDDGVYKTEGVADDATISLRLKNIGDGPACQFWMRETLGFGERSPMEEHRRCVPKESYFDFVTPIRELEKSESSIATLKYENIVGCHFSQRIDFMVSPLPVYAPERGEIEDGYFVDIIVGKTLRLRVSSLTMQSYEEFERK